MTKADLIAQVAEQSNLTKKTTDAALKAFIEAIHHALKDAGDIRIDGLGTFRVSERKERTGVNPRTGAKITIPATKAPAFRAAKALRDAVKGPEKKAEKKKK